MYKVHGGVACSIMRCSATAQMSRCSCELLCAAPKAQRLLEALLLPMHSTVLCSYAIAV